MKKVLIYKECYEVATCRASSKQMYNVIPTFEQYQLCPVTADDHASDFNIYFKYVHLLVLDNILKYQYGIWNYTLKYSS